MTAFAREIQEGGSTGAGAGVDAADSAVGGITATKAAAAGILVRATSGPARGHRPRAGALITRDGTTCGLTAHRGDRASLGDARRPSARAARTSLDATFAQGRQAQPRQIGTGWLSRGPTRQTTTSRRSTWTWRHLSPTNRHPRFARPPLCLPPRRQLHPQRCPAPTRLSGLTSLTSPVSTREIPCRGRS